MLESNPSPGPEPDRAGPEKPRLERQRILQAGVDFIEQHGARQLTMRRLGSALGVEAMSLYRYVPSRESLLDGIVETVIDELYGDPEVYVEPRHGWQDYLLRLAHGLRRLALKHPQVFPLVATRPTEAPWVRPPLRSLRWVESFLAALTSSGFSDRAAVATYRAFSSFLLGHLLLEVAALGADVGPVEEADPHPPASADLDGYPLLQQLQDLLSEDRSAQEFEESLENLMDRLEALAP
ncbi:TetR/AcrR family transcriptional regulator C-terminal domain-containing protein [Arthrobacter sp. I2-34]|uniref:TetR/AcrR family transcriptional regulator C-terminal domain-containing protein n=1 Tax=Arthrobacter hankyongi TaxID=2904801 RepID=A0ABS9L2E9_9MICC|nr:TetR/AcrR family transcriptional regulator C-terminal domain-containing protein [Arthrobacter hankyongi]MCG2620815.1 TetR/AcrR family transcriptional regulator C-terminal domain-containing protein [Arthrobacter hankyongi]